MSEVWLAQDERLDRAVAVKVLSEAATADEANQLVSAMEREARIIARLQHPNIVGVYDAGLHEGQQYLVMEYVQGQSLRQLIEFRGTLPEAEAVHYARQVAGALQYAHQAGVVHCDVKPENILVTLQGAAKVADFGVADTITRTLAPEQAREVLGTLAYLAPEVLQGADASPQSDVYSLALTLYEAVAGRLPFSGANTAAVAGQRLATVAPPLRTHAPGASASLEATLARALALKPSDRFASTADFARALDGSSSGEAARPVVPVVPPPSGPAPRRSSTSRIRPMAAPPPSPSSAGGSGLLVLGLVLLVLALGAGVVAAIILVTEDDEGGSENPTPTVTIDASPTAEPTEPPTEAPTEASPTATEEPTPTPTPSATPTEESPTPTETPTPTEPPVEETPEPTATLTPAP